MFAAALPGTPFARLDFRAALDILIVATLIYYVSIREQGHTLNFRNIVVLLLLLSLIHI